MKMSKSKPDSAIFMTDSEQEVNRKLSKAFCPEKQAKENPVLDYCRHIIFETSSALELRRSEKFGGDKTYKSYDALEADFVSGRVHPADLKKAVAARINELLEPVRKHFSTNAKAKKLLATVKSYEITR